MLLMPLMIFVRTSAPFWNHSVFVILSQIVETILPAASKNERLENLRAEREPVSRENRVDQSVHEIKRGVDEIR